MFFAFAFALTFSLRLTASCGRAASSGSTRGRDVVRLNLLGFLSSMTRPSRALYIFSRLYSLRALCARRLLQATAFVLALTALTGLHSSLARACWHSGGIRRRTLVDI